MKYTDRKGIQKLILMQSIRLEKKFNLIKFHLFTKENEICFESMSRVRVLTQTRSSLIRYI